MSAGDPLSDIVYLSIRSLKTRQIGDFLLDPDVPLPVELPSGQGTPPEISAQAIIAAMLKVLAHRPEAPAADYYRRLVLAVQPDIKREFTQAGIVKFQQGELELAVDIFRSLAGLFPDCGQTRNNLALVLERQALEAERRGEEGRAEDLRGQAFAAYKAALACEPELAPCHLNFAHFHLRRGDPGKAREHLASFLKLNRDPQAAEGARLLQRRLEGFASTEAACAQAFDAIQLGREGEAVELLGAVTARHPELWKGWFLLGWAHRRLKRYGEARRAFQQAYEIDPGSPDLLNELAICLRELGEAAESRRLLEEARRRDPENPKILSNLGVAALSLGEEEEARRLFRAVLAKDPDDPLARGFLT